MSLEIVVSSENKGSNPGGRCIVKTPRGNIFGNSYIKYCTNSDISRSPLTQSHQPIYEAMFLEMAHYLGLKVPDYFVILNDGGAHLKFSYAPEKGEHPKELRGNNSTYFVSVLIEHEIDDSSPMLKELMGEDKIYRDLLHLGDISGRPQNYTLVDKRNGQGPFVMYIDLGCGLVDAHYGRISIRKSLFDKLMKSRLHPNIIRDLKKRLKNVNLRRSGDLGEVNLLDFGGKIPSCCGINVLHASNPQRVLRVQVDSLISQDELQELSDLYFLTNEDFLSRHKGDPRIIK